MIHVIFEIFKIIILLLLLWIGNKWSFVLGGLIWASISWLIVSTSWIGRMLKFLLCDHVKIITILRLCCYIISSSGALLGFLIFISFSKLPLNNLEIYTLLIFCVCALINIVSDLNEEVVTFSSIYQQTKQIAQNRLKISLDEMVLTDASFIRRLSQSTFISIYLPQLFKMLVTIGLIYYCLGNLKVFELNEERNLPDVWDSIKLSFSAIQFVGKPDPIFTGTNWQICSICASFLVFLWTAFFAIAARNVFADEKDIKLETATTAKDELEEFLANEIDVIDNASKPLDDRDDPSNSKSQSKSKN